MANALIWLLLLVLSVGGESVAGYLPRPNTILANSSGQTSVTASTTTYMSPTGANLAFQSDEFLADIRYGRAVTVRNLVCGTSTAQTGSNSIAVTVRNNHADTSITCNITAGASTCNDSYNTTGHSASLAGDTALTLKIVTGTLTGSPTLRCGLEVIAQ